MSVDVPAISQPAKKAPRLSPFRAFCFTWNNPNQHGLLDLISPYEADPADEPAPWYSPETGGASLLEALAALPHFKYCVFQFECAPNSTPHVQGYIEFKNSVRPTALLKVIKGAHVEQRKGPAFAAAAYCRKTDTQLSGPYERGIPPTEVGSGARTDLSHAAALALAGASNRQLAQDSASTYVRYGRGLERVAFFANMDKPRPVPLVILIVSKPGSGKTRFVHDLYSDNPSDLYLCPARASDTSPVWFDGYDGQSALLFDDFDGGMPFPLLLMLLDRYRMMLPVKGGFVPLYGGRFIFITSMMHPAQWYGIFHHVPSRFAALSRRVHLVLEPVPGSSPLVLESDAFWGDLSSALYKPLEDFMVVTSNHLPFLNTPTISSD